MSLPLSERVMRAVLAQLQTITLANGYETDAGANATRSMPGLPLPGELPALLLCETSEVPNSGSATDNRAAMNVAHGFAVEVHVDTESAETAATELGLARADVKRALCGWAGPLAADGGRGVRDADGQIGPLSYLGSDVIEPPAGATTAAINLRFLVTYPEKFGDPYSA